MIMADTKNKTPLLIFVVVAVVAVAAFCTLRSKDETPTAAQEATQQMPSPAPDTEGD